VIGETIHRTPDGDERIQQLQYLRVTPQGLTWGNMNGMRPRGINLFEGTLRDDTLTGAVRFGGIDFRKPDGTAPEPLHFSFKRLRK
jgi:hypothetical protein